ncbi:hypothetical protein [Rhizobium ruizarguesonis]|jgi:hypothetical protein|uniref:hypothetical protein n=1 Tax=Rhizobium ruizarguesonis TaxID=2081791 RepID=UPI0010318573|nr:hypothetical protein [Rhizobium ruizarguesonis]MBY5854182.1 hypothetical protein [Rhizobium leguminosarum]MBY5889459.1 hypothetical protein [Rhizobium leguminosarum]QSZ00671.1 hypothetical protein J3P73_23120 [Rhizobium ruizarguesonis]TAY81361.1 hypothetical protein ELH86_21475 [Rhizobium ruizarguesonis]TAZ36994.1 hypothetical protein ELH80_22795 [Rhizobium ruizarguesonis]
MSDFDAVMTGTIGTEEGVAENYVAVTGGIAAAMETGCAPSARVRFRHLLSHTYRTSRTSR